VREQYFDEGGHPTMIVGGYASQGWEYDARNREKRVSYFGMDEQLVTQDDGYAAIEYDVDERGFLTTWTFLDPAGRPVKSINGFANVRVKRNERGQPLEFAYFDEHGRAAVNTRIGSGQRRITYDPRGKVFERSDFDVNGRPTTNAYGYATMRVSYDKYGHEVGRELIDVTGRSLRSKVIVDRVTRSSVGADAGFLAGDIILTYDGEEVTTTDHFTNQLELFRGDRPREVRVERDKRVVGLALPPGRVGGLILEEKVYPSATR
jgi:hypothetical protein